MRGKMFTARIKKSPATYGGVEYSGYIGIYTGFFYIIMIYDYIAIYITVGVFVDIIFRPNPALSVPMLPTRGHKPLSPA